MEAGICRGVRGTGSEPSMYDSFLETLKKMSMNQNRGGWTQVSVFLMQRGLGNANLGTAPLRQELQSLWERKDYRYISVLESSLDFSMCPKT